MKSICFAALAVCITATLLLGLALFDIINMTDDLRNIIGVVDIIALALFFKTFIRIYKYTHKD